MVDAGLPRPTLASVMLASVPAETVIRDADDQASYGPGDPFEDRARTLLAFPQRRFSALAGIDVDVQPGPFLNTPTRIEHGDGTDVGPAPTATRGTKAELGVHAPFNRYRFPPLPLGIGPIIGMDRVQPAVGPLCGQHLSLTSPT